MKATEQTHEEDYSDITQIDFTPNLKRLSLLSQQAHKDEDEVTNDLKIKQAYVPDQLDGLLTRTISKFLNRIRYSDSATSQYIDKPGFGSSDALLLKAIKYGISKIKNSGNDNPRWMEDYHVSPNDGLLLQKIRNWKSKKNKTITIEDAASSIKNDGRLAKWLKTKLAATQAAEAQASASGEYHESPYEGALLKFVKRSREARKSA